MHGLKYGAPLAAKEYSVGQYPADAQIAILLRVLSPPYKFIPSLACGWPALFGSGVLLFDTCSKRVCQDSEAATLQVCENLHYTIIQQCWACWPCAMPRRSRRAQRRRSLRASSCLHCLHP